MNDLSPGIPALDWQSMPLCGRVLIEASAGTGKTWNIGLIFLRLLLQEQLPVEKILVVTFTEAAAQELRERLRGRLAEAERCLRAMRDGADTADAAGLMPWLANLCGDDTAAQAALRRL